MERMTLEEFDAWWKSVDLSKIEELPNNLHERCYLNSLYNVKTLPDTLPRGCMLSGLCCLRKLPDTLPADCRLHDLHSVEELPATLPEDCVLTGLCRLKKLPDTLPEGCELHDLESPEMPKRLPQRFHLEGLFWVFVSRYKNVLSFGSERHLLTEWMKFCDREAARKPVLSLAQLRFRQIVEACLATPCDEQTK